MIRIELDETGSSDRASLPARPGGESRGLPSSGGIHHQRIGWQRHVPNSGVSHGVLNALEGFEWMGYGFLRTG